MKAINIKLLVTLIMITATFNCCKKYLDAKPDKKLVVPSTIADLQSILDYYRFMNILCSEASEVASDNYYLTDNSFLALQYETSRKAYLWNSGIFQGFSPDDWVNEYDIVFNANVVLDNIKNIKRDATIANGWDNCKGSALVFRAKSFFEIAQIWAKAYVSASAATDLGIPLRLTSDFNVPSTRATLLDTYDQIINDLSEALPLLPDVPVHPYRPSKAAAYALLSKTYLIIGDYSKAKQYTDNCLQINNSLLDFNTLNPNASFPFSALQFSNSEDIMHSVCKATNSNIRSNVSRIDSALYQSYNINDLRRTIFFKNNADGSAYFVGSYDGSGSAYNGVAVDEQYLVRAECNARLGNVVAAMSDLNALMIKRWKNNGTFVPFTATNASDALNQILIERRKELIYRMIRFSDVKRLNKEGTNIILKRVVQGQTYILSPNDPKYALPIPDNVIQFTGMPQN